jgi:hypothetical protein
MKKYLLSLFLGVTLISFTIPQFFYYNDTRKAIAIRDNQEGTLIVRDYSGNKVLVQTYPANSSRWVSIYRLEPGQYTATTTDGGSLSFYRRP